MGISGLLLLPVTAPARGFLFFLERLRDEADAVLYDEGRAFAELIELSVRHNAGQLSAAEYAEQEAELIQRLSSIHEYRSESLYADVGEDGLDENEEDW
jgi:hypothetical protein